MERPLPDWKQFRALAGSPSRVATLQAPGAQDRPPSHQAPSPRALSLAELKLRQQANSLLLEIAETHLEWLSTLLTGSAHCICLADKDGVLLQTRSNWPDSDTIGLKPGYIWSEPAMGSNGIGTAIATQQPVSVIAEVCAGSAVQAQICMAAPIHSTPGRTLGAIGISTPLGAADPNCLLLAAHTAMVIEQSLAAATRAVLTEPLELLALLASFTAHELVSPLTANKTLLSLLSREVLPATAQPLVAAANRNAERLLQVVTDLRILGGSPDRCLQAVNLPHLVGQVAARAGLNGRLELQAALTPRTETILCNPALLARALENLLCNAREATAEHGRIGVQLLEAEENVRIIVWDTGPGFPGERRPPPLQEAACASRPSGSGLGLLLTRAIVERVHEGHLRFRPNRPSGCRFELELPLALVSSQ